MARCKIYVDLTDDQWRAVEIVPAQPDTTERWRIVDRPPVRFLRTSGMPMPAPAPGGTIDDLRRWFNVKSEADLRLTIAWMLNCYRDRGPYPILVIHGGQGSGKSTLARLLMRFTDPQEADLRSPPKEERDLWVATQHARVLAYDNLSSISAGLADAFCRISTGGAQAERTLHSNTDETILRGCRPLMLNAIVDIVRRPDLADRAVQVEAKRLMDRRRTEEEFWGDFDEEEPLLLGALFDVLSFALGNYRDTTVPANLRMADCARWAEAPAQSLNWRSGELSLWWQQNRAAGDLTIIEGDIVAAPLVAFLNGQGDGWEGSTGELLARLEEMVTDKVHRSRGWPLNVQQLRSKLDRLQASLGTVGWTFDRERAPTALENSSSRELKQIPRIPLDVPSSGKSESWPRRPFRQRFSRDRQARQRAVRRLSARSSSTWLASGSPAQWRPHAAISARRFSRRSDRR